MNKVFLMGRLTRDPDVRQSQGENPITIARYTLAIDRRKTQNNQDPGADFVSCIAFGRNGDFAEKWLHKGTKIVIEGHIQTGSYNNKDNQKIYTTDVVIDSQEFAESRGGLNEEDKAARDQAALEAAGVQMTPEQEQDFMNIPDGIEEELPFN